MSKTLDPASVDLRGIVRPGDHIVWGQGTGEPQTLTEALVRQRAELGPLNLFLASGFSNTLQGEHADQFRMTGFGAVGTMRRLTKAGVLGVVPCHVSQLGAYIEQGLIGCDVAFIQASPKGPDGKHSFGIIHDFVQSAVAKARTVVVEVNDQVPWVYGAAALEDSRIDYVVHTSRPLLEVPSAVPGEGDKAIAGHIAKFIQDGTVLQIGIGAVPDAVMAQLTDRKDIGIHSGSIGDGLMALVEAGVVTNARKEIDKGMSIVGALIGTKKLYNWAHQNKAIAFRPSSYTHGDVLGQLSRLVTINSAMEVDLTGQINAEQAGDDYIGGIGGQAFYARAGHFSKGGHGIMALPATAKGGAITKIVSKLSGPVTTLRSDADIIVTEFGAAELRGQPIPERVRRMIAIAHPNFRESLEREAHDMLRRGY